MKKKLTNNAEQLYFRRFSRKKYAAFSSLSKTIKISTLGAACTLIASPVQSQAKTEGDTISTKIDLEEVEVVGQKSTLLMEELPRVVEIIDAQSIQNAPSQSFQDLIQYASNIDISQRGQFGIQSDVSIRGGSFDQVLILQNGINLTDPQTGHHNLNLPIDYESIYKIEILNGPAARALGANAFTGAINIITKPLSNNQVSASVNAGEYGFFRGNLGLNLVINKTKHLLSASYSESNGYITNTDFTGINFNYHGQFTISNSIQSFLQLGVNTKTFGANSYYTPKYPDQFEETSTYFFSAGLKTNGTVKTKSEVFWRRHTDRFELFREGDNYYTKGPDGLYRRGADTAGFRINDTTFYAYGGHNFHVTDIFGTNLNASFYSIAGTTTLGSGIRSENLLSNNLGVARTTPLPVPGYPDEYYTNQDFRNSFDIYIEQAYKTDEIFISGGFLTHWNSFEPQKINFIPGIDFFYSPADIISLIGSYNYTIGHPTFTDLGYRGPDNEGNPDLKPYYQHSMELGLKTNTKNTQFGITAFYTRGKDNINWVRNESSNRFVAMNIDLVENRGIEVFTRYKNPSKGLSNILIYELYLGYTFIDTYLSTPDNISKYSNIRNKLVTRLEQKITNNLLLSWNFMYKERIGTYLGYDFETEEYTYNNYPDAILIDLRASYKVNNFVFYAEGSNLLDTFYVESGSIPQPGRWFKGGIKYTLNY
jgi:iron complex outermembrane receptor protein